MVNTSQRYPWLSMRVFAFLSLGALCITLLWSVKPPLITGEDAASHVLSSVEAHRSIVMMLGDHARPLSHRLSAVWFLFRHGFDAVSPWYPFLVYFFTAAIYGVLGVTVFAAKLTNVFFLILLLLSLYGVSRQILPRWGGVLAAYILLMYPLIYESSRQYGLDLPLTAVVFATFYLLLRSEGLTRAEYAFLAGIGLGLGTLIKMQIVIFVLVPLLWVCGDGLVRAIRVKKPYPAILQVLRNGVVMLCVAISIASSWWWPHRSVFHQFFEDGSYAVRIADIDTRALREQPPSRHAVTDVLAKKMGYSAAGSFRVARDEDVLTALEAALKKNDFPTGFDVVSPVAKQWHTAHPEGIDRSAGTSPQDATWRVLNRNLDLLRTMYPRETRHARVWSDTGRQRFSFSWYTRNLSALCLHGLSIPGTILLVLSAICFLRSPVRMNVLFTGMIIVPVVISSCIHNNQMHIRHLMPLLPLFALISAWGVMSIPWCCVRRTVYALIAVSFSLQYACTTVTDGATRETAMRYLLPVTTPGSDAPRKGFTDYVDTPSAYAEFRVDDLLHLIPLPDDRQRTVMLIDASDEKPDQNELRYLFMVRGYDLVDTFSMSTVLLSRWRSVEYIVCKLPAQIHLDTWPSRGVMEQLLLNTHSFKYYMFIRTPEKSIILSALEQERPPIRLVATLPTVRGFQWVLFARNMTGRGDATTPGKTREGGTL